MIVSFVWEKQYQKLVFSSTFDDKFRDTSLLQCILDDRNIFYDILTNPFTYFSASAQKTCELFGWNSTWLSVTSTSNTRLVLNILMNKEFSITRPAFLY